MDKAELVRRLKQSVFQMADEIEEPTEHTSETLAQNLIDIAQDMRNTMDDCGDDLYDVIGATGDFFHGDKKEWILNLTGILLGMVADVTDDEWASIMAMLD